MSRLITRLLIALSAITTVNANAASLICSGTVAELAYHSPGKLMVRLSSMNVGVIFCSTDTEWAIAGTEYGNTSPASCKALYNSFIVAKALGTNISRVHFDGPELPGSCDGFSPWATVSLRYAVF
jgi:hypothetical protein